MTTAERIYTEAKRLPEALANEVLDFILDIEQRHAAQSRIPHAGAFSEQEIRHEEMTQALAAYRLPLSGYQFDRDEAHGP
ncbi:MAG: hypothetical protein HQL87_12245 [Magnetococcales bacterium]|nr:hypothetical protein [Magnetococcales bacterium]